MQKPLSARFVAFEGGEGTGKSTQIQRISQALTELGCSTLVTREPGGTDLAEKIREVLLDPQYEKMNPRTEALLYAAARAEHVDKVIRPALHAGKIVLCDRFLDASRAYQGAGRGLGIAAIDQLNLWAIEKIVPDRCYVFDLDPRIGLARAAERQGGKLDRLESEDIDFHDKIRALYRARVEGSPENYRLIDASMEVDKVTQTLLEDIQSWISKT